MHFLPQGKLGNNPRLFFLRVFKLLLLAASWITIYQLVLLCSFGVVVQVVQVQVVQVEGAEVKEEAINLFVTVGHDLCFPPVPQTWKIYLAKICFAGKVAHCGKNRESSKAESNNIFCLICFC